VVLDLLPGLHAVGGIATADGLFDALLPPGTKSLGVRAFANGMQSKAVTFDLSSPDLAADSGFPRWVLELTPIAPSDVGRVPKTTAFAPSVTSVATGDPLAFTATVFGGSPSDPVSSDVVLVDPNHYTVTTLAEAKDGTYKTPDGFSAPGEAGTFGYYLAARTQGNIGGDVASVEVAVRSKQPSVHFKATIVDATTNAPLANAIVAIEYGAHPFADTSRPSPYFQFGALAAADGTIDVLVPGEKISAHALANGYARGDRFGVDPSAPATIAAPKLAPAQLLAKPLVSGFAASPTIVPAGTGFDLSAQIAHGPGTDLLSDGVLVVEATSGVSFELAPPAPGRLGVGYPDGTYARHVTAPTKPGMYTYRLVAVSQGGVVSDAQTTSVTVQ
jgi:hypothetical protein